MEAASGPFESNLIVIIRSARMIIVAVIFREYIIFYKPTIVTLFFDFWDFLRTH